LQRIKVKKGDFSLYQKLGPFHAIGAGILILRNNNNPSDNDYRFMITTGKKMMQKIERTAHPTID